jgi:hypothetical protein
MAQQQPRNNHRLARADGADQVAGDPLTEYDAAAGVAARALAASD